MGDKGLIVPHGFDFKPIRLVVAGDDFAGEWVGMGGHHAGDQGHGPGDCGILRGTGNDRTKGNEGGGKAEA